MANEINQVKIVTININSINRHKHELKNFLAKEDIDIAFVQETFLKPNQTFTMKGYNIIRTDRNRHYSPVVTGGGALIAIDKRICFRTVELPCNDNEAEIAGAIIELNKKETAIFSIYRSPKSSTIFSSLERIFETFPTALVTGDLNAKSIAWGCRSTTKAGKELLKILHKYNINVDHPDVATSIPSSGYGDIIDLFLSKNIYISKPQVLLDLSSDHHPVLAKVLGIATAPLQPIYKSIN